MDDAERYTRATAALKTGIELESRYDPGSLSNHQLRLAFTALSAESSALVQLLIAKGVFTMEEYTKAVAASMLSEVRRTETRLGPHIGGTISLLGSSA